MTSSELKERAARARKSIKEFFSYRDLRTSSKWPLRLALGGGALIVLSTGLWMAAGDWGVFYVNPTSVEPLPTPESTTLPHRLIGERSSVPPTQPTPIPNNFLDMMVSITINNPTSGKEDTLIQYLAKASTNPNIKTGDNFIEMDKSNSGYTDGFYLRGLDTNGSPIAAGPIDNVYLACIPGTCSFKTEHLADSAVVKNTSPVNGNTVHGSRDDYISGIATVYYRSDGSLIPKKYISSGQGGFSLGPKSIQVKNPSFLVDGNTQLLPQGLVRTISSDSPDGVVAAFSFEDTKVSVVSK